MLRVHVFILVLLPACVHGEQVGWRSWTRWTRWLHRGSSNNLIISLRKVNERMKEFFFYFCRVCELLTSSEFNYLLLRDCRFFFDVVFFFFYFQITAKSSISSYKWGGDGNNNQSRSSSSSLMENGLFSDDCDFLFFSKESLNPRINKTSIPVVSDKLMTRPFTFNTLSDDNVNTNQRNKATRTTVARRSFVVI